MGDIVLQNPLGNTRHFGIISNETVGEFRLRSFVPAEYTLIWRGDVLKNYEKMVCGTIHIVVQLTSGRHPNTSVGRIVKDVALSGTSVLLDCFAAATKSDSKLATKNLLYSDQALMEAFEKLKEEFSVFRKELADFKKELADFKKELADTNLCIEARP